MKRPQMAPKGKNPGVFREITLESGTDAGGLEYSRLQIAIELQAKDSSDKPYRVAKEYNLLGRGLATFRKDYSNWSGRQLTDDDLVAFDADAQMKDKPVVVDVDHRSDGKKVTMVAGEFYPAPAA